MAVQGDRLPQSREFERRRVCAEGQDFELVHLPIVDESEVGAGPRRHGHVVVGLGNVQFHPPIALPDDRRDGVDASHCELLLGDVPVERFEI